MGNIECLINEGFNGFVWNNETYKIVCSIINNNSIMQIGYCNYNGGINNLVYVSSYGIITTSRKDKETAIKNHKRKLNKLNVIDVRV